MVHTVTFSTAIGGDGSVVTDDDDVLTGLANGGHLLRYVKCLANMVSIAFHTVAKAAIASDKADIASAAAIEATEAKVQTEASAAGIYAAIVAAGLADNPPIQINPSTIHSDLTIASGYNASSVGPLMIAEGVSVTINDNSNWIIL